MPVGAFLEPLVVVTLLFGGAWINRRKSTLSNDYDYSSLNYNDDEEAILDEPLKLPLSSSTSRTTSPSPPSPSPYNLSTRPRTLQVLGFRKVVFTPDLQIFRARLLSRLLNKFPFLVEIFYWALIYWVYQLGRAFTALTLREHTVVFARYHALQIIDIETQLAIFIEIPIQQFFIQRPNALIWINRIYAFIHIPGSVLFLVWLYYFTISKYRPENQPKDLNVDTHNNLVRSRAQEYYQSCRRTMAISNLLAFIIFTAWPCMPPRLLSENDAVYEDPNTGISYGFIDTTHGEHGQKSVWTDNKFVNHYAAMPSMHFGYALLICLSLSFVPLPKNSQSHSRSKSDWRRTVLVTVGCLYASTILLVIIATANHFILDAVFGFLTVALGWNINSLLLNLLPLEDWFLWSLGICKPT